VQFDPPDDPRDYIHRVGRTARAGKVGKSLLFLLESELGFLRFLKEAKVPLNEFTFPADRIANVQSQLEKLLQKNYFLHQSAKDGYRAYLQSYASYSLKKIFDVNKLDLAKVGKAFGFAVPPRVNISIGGGKGGTGRSGVKRKRDEDSDNEGEDENSDNVAADVSRRKAVSREGERARRIERLGKRKVEREVYRKGPSKANWSR